MAMLLRSAREVEEVARVELREKGVLRESNCQRSLSNEIHPEENWRDDLYSSTRAQNCSHSNASWSRGRTLRSHQRTKTSKQHE